MATIDTMLKRALRLIEVQDAGESVSSLDSSTALSVLNNMMARWEEDGVAVGWSEVDSTADTAPAPNSALSAIEANWAILLAPEYGKDPRQMVLKMASDGYADVQRDSIKNAITKSDMTHLPNASGGAYDINSDT